MEDILASIRRILKDEAVPTVAEEPEDEDILVLDSSMVAKPVDLSSATMPPMAEDETASSGLGPDQEHFASEPAPFAAPFEAKTAAVDDPDVDLNAPFKPVPLPDPIFSSSPTEAPAVPATGTIPTWPAAPAPGTPDLGAYKPVNSGQPSAMPVFGHRHVPDFGAAAGDMAAPSSAFGAKPPEPTPAPEPVTSYTPLPFPARPPINPGIPTTPVFGSKFSPDFSRLNTLPPSLQPSDEKTQSITPESTEATASESTPMPVETFMPESNDSNYTPPTSLIDNQVSAAAASAIGAMVRSISAEKSVAVSRGGATIEDMVREEIRPLLKAWLDTNLQSLVERVVRTEIEKVVNRSLD